MNENENKRPPLNGGKLIMALPLWSGNRIVEYVVLVEVHDYVVSRVPELDSPSWGQGYYFPKVNEASLDNAIKFAYVYAGLPAMPWADIEAGVRRAPGHF